jgi:hypothetical protein
LIQPAQQHAPFDAHEEELPANNLNMPHHGMKSMIIYEPQDISNP